MAFHYQKALLPKCSFSRMILLSKQEPSLFYTKIKKSPPCVVLSTTLQCKLEPSTTIVSDQNLNESRRSTNYFAPSVWNDNYIQSLNSGYVAESYAQESDRLKEEVRDMFGKMENHMDQLQLIDVLQRLGVASHFRLEIRNILDKVYDNKDRIIKGNINDLHATALEFRLLRQHGYDVSSDVLNGFKDNKGDFDTHHSTDMEGLLSLYEASFHSMEDEIILEEARDFSSRYLKEFVNKNNNSDISELINHALELPLQWRVLRLEAHWFIHFYERSQNMNSALLQLAKLDFNIVQVYHQEDLTHSSRWWKRVGFGEKLDFARDRLVENFFWTVGLAFEPQFGDFRKVMTKVNAFITTIDDIYDVYGTLEELELFTYAVDRWDINAMDILPDYMKICFLALYNFVNEVAFDYLKENGHHIISEFKKAWADLCKSYLVEAKWYYSGYKPSLQEYMENAWVSISAPLILVHAYFSLPHSAEKEEFVCLQDYSNIIRFSATILRLADDLGTSKREKETGDVPKSIECYMNETGVSEDDARRHINNLIWSTWKKMNKEVSNSRYSKSFIEISMNLARMSLCMYLYGDGHTVQDLETNNCIMSLLFKPITVKCSKN